MRRSILEQATVAASLLFLIAIPCHAKKGGNGGGNGGGPGGGDSGSECSGGVHVCNIEDAFNKCGVSRKDRNKPATRNVMCCCHSDVCPQACFEEALSSTGDLDALATVDADGNVVPNTSPLNTQFVNEAIIWEFDLLDQSIRDCNARGDLGGVDMVPKCARVDSDGNLTCPTGGATDVPAGGDSSIIGSGQEFCEDCDPLRLDCYNEWCVINNNSSCPTGSCICVEDSQLP
jgi:hypothetical protein